MENDLGCTRNKIQVIGMSALARCSGAVIEYPLECIKTRWQTNQGVLSFYSMSKISYRKYGLLGFYDGFMPYLAKKLPVQFVRWPVVLQLPDYIYNYFRQFDLLNDRSYKMIALSNLTAGLIIASIETPLAAPFDTCRIELNVNRDSNNSILKYFKQNRHVPDHFKGVSILYIKEILGWTSFLVSLNTLRAFRNKNSASRKVEVLSNFVIPLVCGLLNSTCVTPCDVIRNNLQKKENKTIVSVKTVADKIYKLNGMKGFFTGWKIRMFQMTLSSALSMPILEKYESQINSTKAKII